MILFYNTLYLLITSKASIHGDVSGNLMFSNCGTLGDNELLESLLFDAEATRGSVTSWLKENLHYNSNNVVSLT